MINKREVMKRAFTIEYEIDDFFHAESELDLLLLSIINAKDVHRETVLMWAIRNDKEEIAKLVIQFGADVNTKSNEGSTALIYAIKYNKEIYKELIRSGANINTKGDDGQTALIQAVSIDKEDIVKVLIQNKAKVNVEDGRGRTALTWAFTLGSKKIAKLLVQVPGADANQTYKGFTALMWSFIYNFEEVAKLLIQNGADVNAASDDGRTALLIACSSNRSEEVIDLLIQSGADVNASNDGWTALRCTSNPKVKKMLKQAGATE